MDINEFYTCHGSSLPELSSYMKPCMYNISAPHLTFCNHSCMCFFVIKAFLHQGAYVFCGLGGDGYRLDLLTNRILLGKFYNIKVVLVFAMFCIRQVIVNNLFPQCLCLFLGWAFQELQSFCGAIAIFDASSHDFEFQEWSSMQEEDCNLCWMDFLFHL